MAANQSENPHRPIAYCPQCRRHTTHLHRHTPAYPDLPETHQVGSEHFECLICENKIFKGRPGAENFRFTLD